MNKKRMSVSLLGCILFLCFSGIVEAAEAIRPYDVTGVRVIVNGKVFNVQAAPGEENLYKAFPAQASDWPDRVNVEVGWEWNGMGDDPGDRCRFNEKNRPRGKSNQGISAPVEGNDGRMTAIFEEVDRSMVFEAGMRCRSNSNLGPYTSKGPGGKRYLSGEIAKVMLSPNAGIVWDPQASPVSPCEFLLKPKEGDILTEAALSLNVTHGDSDYYISYAVEKATKFDTGVHGDLTLDEGKAYVQEWEEVARGAILIESAGARTEVWSRNPDPGFYRLSLWWGWQSACSHVNFEIVGAQAPMVAQGAVPAAGISGAPQSATPGSSPKGGFGSAAMVVKGVGSGPSASGKEETPSEGGRVIDPTAKYKFNPQPEPPAYQWQALPAGEHPPEPGKDANVPRSGQGATGFGARGKRVASAQKMPLHVGKPELSIKRLSLSPSPLKAGDTARFEVVFENSGKIAGSPDAKYGISCHAVPAGAACPVPVGTFAVGKAVPAGGSAGTTLLAAKPAEPGTFRVVVTMPPGSMKDTRKMIVEVAEPPPPRKAKKKIPAPAETESVRESAPLIKPRLRTP